MQLVGGMIAALPPHSPAGERWRPVAYHVHRALGKLPPYEASQVYRGIGCRLDGYQEGRFVQWPAFSSSTADPNVVRQFTGSAGSLFIIRPRRAGRGRMINFLSEFTKARRAHRHY